MSAFARIPAARWLRAAGIVAAAAVLGWIAQASTISTVMGARRLETTLAWWPSGSIGLAAAASQFSVMPQTPAQLAESESLATRALSRDPTNVIAARTLGLVYARRGNQPVSDRLLHYAEALSRRDLATQLWFIESSVQRNDIDEALRHYDRALRTSRRARDVLLPILVRAAADPAISDPLARLVAQRPPWWSAFMNALTDRAPSAAALDRFVRVSRLDQSNPGDRNKLAAALDRMIGLGAYRDAAQLYATFGNPIPAGPERVRNGGFEEEGGFGPLEWRYANEPDLAGVRAASPSGAALTVTASPGANGEVARQLLLLPPGRFRLSYRTGNLRSDQSTRIALRLVCANSGREIANAPAAASGAGAANHQDFAVPADRCPAQQLVVDFASNEEQGGEAASRPWIDNISVRPL